MEEKLCKGCGLILPVSSFYKYRASRDGYWYWCKPCDRERHQDMPPHVIEKRRAYSRAYRKSTPERLEHCRETARDYWKTSERTRSVHREAARIWEKTHPEEKSAHAAVKWALKSGKLVRIPCAVCGREDSQAHHEDYSKKLDVVFLCPVCHSARHTEMEMARACQEE